MEMVWPTGKLHCTILTYSATWQMYCTETNSKHNLRFTDYNDPLPEMHEMVWVNLEQKCKTNTFPQKHQLDVLLTEQTAKNLQPVIIHSCYQ